MKEKTKLIKNKAGVSAVIGVILMVAITVAIACTVYVYIIGMDFETECQDCQVEMVLSKIDIDKNYTFIDMTFDYSVNDFYFVEINLLDMNNISTVTVTGFLYNKNTEELLYNDSSDIIKLKDIEK